MPLFEPEGAIRKVGIRKRRQEDLPCLRQAHDGQHVMLRRGMFVCCEDEHFVCRIHDISGDPEVTTARRTGECASADSRELAEIVMPVQEQLDLAVIADY